MNKEKILEVANLIEKSSPQQFHMSSWFGVLKPASDHDDFEEWQDIGLDIFPDQMIPEPIPRMAFSTSLFVETEETVKLQCNTTACIAGWAIANEFFNKNEDPINKFNNGDFGAESLGAQILGLTSYEASRLFFCDENSIWVEYAQDYGYNFDVDIPESWNIHPKHAADLLRRIANGEILLDEDGDEE